MVPDGLFHPAHLVDTWEYRPYHLQNCYCNIRMDFSISDHCDLASVACWWWRRRIPVKRPLESLVPRLKIGGSLYTFTQKIVISLLWLTFDLEQSFSSEISRIYLPNNRPKTVIWRVNNHKIKFGKVSKKGMIVCIICWSLWIN